MKITINQHEYDYNSDYPDGWKFISRDHFKSPVSIGDATLFIKRFPSRKSGLPGIDFMRLISGKKEESLPKVHAVVDLQEGNKNFHYVFTDCIEGLTLNKVLEQGLPIDLAKLTRCLLDALQSIHRYRYWFPDFTERNIFAESTGQYLLIDLDSCESIDKAPDTELDVSKDYWILVFSFYREILNEQLKPAELPGKLLNYLQVIFLVLQLQRHYVNGKFEFLSEQAFKELPKQLDTLSPEFRSLFEDILRNRLNPVYEVPVKNIERLIREKILGLPAAPEVPKMEAKSVFANLRRLFPLKAVGIAGVLIAVLLIWKMIPSKQKANPAVVDKVSPDVVTPSKTILIEGGNFPLSKDKIQVLVDKTVVELSFISKTRLNAVTPDLGAEKDGSRIILDIVVEGDTILTSKEIVFRQR